jgi:hypothetical protein
MKKSICGTLWLMAILALASGVARPDEEDTRNILKQGLVGAGAGALAAGASGGNAGQGALIGAGTNVIGSALLDAISSPSSSSSSRGATRAVPVRSARTAPQQQYADDYYEDQGEEYYVEEEAPPQESSTQRVLKQGLVGAGAGALAAGASGGNAGKGALIGAGTNVIGSALLDAITQPPQQQRRTRVYRRPVPAQPVVQAPAPVQPKRYTSEEATAETGGAGSHKKVIKKYDDSGKLVSEEEIYY